MIKALTFDLDDTLWDARAALMRAEAAHYAWIEAHAPRIAARYTAEDVRRRRRMLAEQRPEIAHDFTLLRHTALSLLLHETGYPEALAGAGIEHFVRVRSAVSLYADARPALQRLRRNYRLVALTNGNADVDIAGVGDCFEACVSPAEAGVRKPDPAMFHAALERVGAAPHEAVHVGDQPLYDIEGARRARMRAVWINRDGEIWPEHYAPAQAEIRTLDELHDTLQRLESLVSDPDANP